MKKSIKRSLVLVSILMVVLTMSFILVGCNKTDKKLQSMLNNVSYYNSGVYVAEDNNFYVELADGKREKALIADGEVGEMADYCMLKVTPINMDMTNRSINFKLTGDKGDYSGSLEKSIVGINFNASISEPQKLGTFKSLTITVGENEYKYELVSILQGGLDYKKAVESVYNNCQEEIKEMFDGSKFKSEIYVKISCDRSKNPKEYFWFINVVENSDNMFCVLVNMKTGEIVAKKHK